MNWRMCAACAPEQTANFVAILACDTSGDPLYAYSGYLLGYIHLSNALYGASYEKWLEIAQQVCQTANEDILANNAYWQQFESPVSKAADSAYSGFLQSYDQELGSKKLRRGGGPVGGLLRRRVKVCRRRLTACAAAVMIVNIPMVCMKGAGAMARNKYPEETVARILDVSLKLFLEKGYENTTIQDIIDALGNLSKGAIYHHFKSKEDILAGSVRPEAVCRGRGFDERGGHG